MTRHAPPDPSTNRGQLRQKELESSWHEQAHIPPERTRPGRASPKQFQASYRLWLLAVAAGLFETALVVAPTTRPRSATLRRGLVHGRRPTQVRSGPDPPSAPQPALTDTILAGKVDTNHPGPGEDSYAYGFSDQRINGVRIVGHDGGSPGYEGQLDIYPDRGDVAVILTNQDQVLTPAIQRSQAMLTSQP